MFKQYSRTPPESFKCVEKENKNNEGEDKCKKKSSKNILNKHKKNNSKVKNNSCKKRGEKN